MVGMGGLLDPTVSSRILSKSSDISYFIRGFFRNGGEVVGLPQAIPDDRKIDYVFRDTFMPMVMASAFEGGFRAAEEWYVKPLSFKQLMLDSMHKLYSLTPDKGQAVHTPAEVIDLLKQAKLPIQSYSKFPEILSSRMLGTIIQSRSYYTVPYLIEQEEVSKLTDALEKLVKKGGSAAEIRKLQGEIANTKLLAHHIRRVLEPERYLTKYLGPEGINHLNTAEVEQVKGLLGRLDKFIKLFGSASSHDPAAAIELRKLFKEFAANPATKDSALAKKLAGIENNYFLVRELKGASIWDKSFKYLKKRMGFSKALKHIQKYEGMPAETYINKVIHEILVPFAEATHGKGSKVVEIFKDLSQSKLAKANINNIFKSGGMYVKLPLSILANLVAWTLIANNFDYFWLQPFQERIVQKRGDSREVLVPSYMGMLPGAAAFIGLFSAKPVQRLGYLGSFAVAAAGGLAAYVGSTMAMFYANLARPRDVEAARQSLKMKKMAMASKDKKNPAKSEQPVFKLPMPQLSEISEPVKPRVVAKPVVKVAPKAEMPTNPWASYGYQASYSPTNYYNTASAYSPYGGYGYGTSDYTGHGQQQQGYGQANAGQGWYY